MYLDNQERFNASSKEKKVILENCVSDNSTYTSERMDLV